METATAREALSLIVKHLPEPIVVLGGWGVYLLVNEDYTEEHGVPYLGSRDLDLGFHIDPELSLEKLKGTTYAKTLAKIEDIGYSPAGTSRYCRFVHTETGQTLSKEEAAGVPLHFLFYLYFDPIPDRIHPRHSEVFKIKPIDEPLLELAFLNNRFVEVMLDETPLLIPEPAILVATKLNAFSNRQKDDKRIKDACDTYALLWHSVDDPGSLNNTVRKEFPDQVENARLMMRRDIIGKAAEHLGIEPETFEDVIGHLVEK